MILEILRDSVWQFVGAVLALFGIVAAYRIYVLQAQYKELAAGVLSTRSLIQVDNHISERVNITLDGSPILNVSLYVIAIKNSGTAPILSQDFLRPIRITFPTNHKVISATVARQSPSSLDLQVNVGDDTVTLEPTLLNPLDEAEIQILASTSEKNPEVSFRVIGVSAASPIHPFERMQPKRETPLPVALVFVMTLVATILSLRSGILTSFPEGGPMRYAVLVALGGLLVMTGTHLVIALNIAVGKRRRRTLRDA